MEADVSVIIPAAGLSLRMGDNVRKPFIMIGEKPVFFYTLEKFYRIKRIKEIIFVVNKEDLSTVMEVKKGKIVSVKAFLSWILTLE